MNVRTDAEIEEALNREYDAEKGARLIEAGRTVTTATLLADIQAQHQATADRVMREGLRD